MIQEFDFDMLEKYLLEIGCTPFNGRFNKVWEVFGCFLAYRYGLDATSLLDNIYNPDRFNTPGSSYKGFEHLTEKSDEELAAFVGCSAIDGEIEVFKRSYLPST